jgi:hypothetical protein
MPYSDAMLSQVDSEQALRWAFKSSVTGLPSRINCRPSLSGAICPIQVKRAPRFSDLGHILKASGCGARLDLDAMPYSDAMLSQVDSLQTFALRRNLSDTGKTRAKMAKGHVQRPTVQFRYGKAQLVVFATGERPA